MNKSRLRWLPLVFSPLLFDLVLVSPWLGILNLVGFFFVFDWVDKNYSTKSVVYFFPLGWFLSIIGLALPFLWITRLSFMLYLVALFISGCFYGLWLMFVAWCFKRHFSPFLKGVLFSFGWVLMEKARSLGYLGFPAGLLGFNLAMYLPLVWLTRFISVYGISGLIVGYNWSLYYGIRHHKIRWANLFLFMWIGVGAIAGAVIHEQFYKKPIKTIKVGLLQPCTPLPEKRTAPPAKDIVAKLLTITQENPRWRDADLIIWPETAVHNFLLEDKEAVDYLLDWVGDSGIALVTGTLGFLPGTKRYAENIAVLLNRGEIQVYKKILLLPGVEAPFLLGKGWGLYSAGKDYSPLVFEDLRFGVAICFEELFSNHLKKFKRKGANTILVLTNNEAAFGNYLPFYEYMLMVDVMMAIETGLPLIKCANNGISSVVDPLGRIKFRSKLNERRLYLTEFGFQL